MLNIMQNLFSDIEKDAGVIIQRDGINALTVDSLSRQMKISKEELSNYFKRDDDLLAFLAQRLENELRNLSINIAMENYGPEEEFDDFFKSLYNYFSKKSYFLDLMLLDTLHIEDYSASKILFKIKEGLRNRLTQIIEKGKETKVFNPDVNCNQIAQAIMNSFRVFMSDIPLTHKMILN